jgi:hypothetical protein
LSPNLPLAPKIYNRIQNTLYGIITQLPLIRLQILLSACDNKFLLALHTFTTYSKKIKQEQAFALWLRKA